MLENLQDSLFAAGVLVLFGALILLFMYIFRREYVHRSSSLKQSRDDLANMMILLQTMRDLLDQQKLLARQLNASLDKKVTFIRESVDSAMKDLEELRAGIKQAAAAQAQRAQETNGRKEESQGPNGHDSRTHEPPRKTPHLTVVERGKDEEREERPSLQLLALPKAPPGDEDIIESWVGLDFGGDEPDPFAFEVPETPPEAPEDAEAAREAFRALLNLEPQPAVKAQAITGSATHHAVSAGGNGRNLSPLHSRVYEYNDAGMTVAQIAQEIGIGKGEVRLILSLRKNRSD
ncbi:MAG: hypothetical protein AMXMBFR82_31910 [Candidatus Hydrogenedentota bacterium]